MKASRPPVLASWLLKHLVPNEILAGDLLEEFGERGSGWYWRQVLAAIIVGFFEELRGRWRAVLFALVFFIVAPLRYIWGVLQFRSLLHFGGRLQWPVSLISEIAVNTLFNAIILVVAIGVYLVVVRDSHPRKLTHAFVTGLSVVALSISGIFCASALLPFRLLFVFPFIAYLPLLLGLLASVWIVAPNVARTDSKSLPAKNGSNS
jgi:hypothetical protein